MNADGPKIEIFKPFGEAFEVMKKILFQPFDLKKWLVIGFAAWLANLGSGGGSFNYQPSGEKELKKINDAISQIPHSILIGAIVVVIVLALVLFVVSAWLRARGGFMFIECIVKNRGAIKEPWREFRKEGNSYFLFSLLVLLGFLILAGLLSLPFAIPAIQNGHFLRNHDVYVISAMAAWILLMVFIILVWELVAGFMIPVMYRQRCRASKAFTIVTQLVAAYPGEILLYCLFWIVLALASVVVGCFAACATCCVVAIPYVGTVILLPVFVLLRSFTLLFLRQFGPDYDLWAGLMPGDFASVLLPVPVPQPPAPSSEG